MPDRVFLDDDVSQRRSSTRGARPSAQQHLDIAGVMFEPFFTTKGLRPLLEALGLASTLDTIVVSGEELIEKPDRRLFEIACRRLGVEPSDTLHVGDSPIEDIEGARAAGCHAWLWGVDVSSFDELALRLGAAT